MRAIVMHHLQMILYLQDCMMGFEHHMWPVVVSHKYISKYCYVLMSLILQTPVLSYLGELAISSKSAHLFFLLSQSVLKILVQQLHSKGNLRRLP